MLDYNEPLANNAVILWPYALGLGARTVCAGPRPLRREICHFNCGIKMYSVRRQVVIYP